MTTRISPSIDLPPAAPACAVVELNAIPPDPREPVRLVSGGTEGLSVRKTAQILPTIYTAELSRTPLLVVEIQKSLKA